MKVLIQNVSDGDIFGFAMNLDAASGSRTVIVQKNGSTIDTVTIPTANEDNIFLPIAGDTSGTDSSIKNVILAERLIQRLQVLLRMQKDMDRLNITQQSVELLT